MKAGFIYRRESDYQTKSLRSRKSGQELPLQKMQHTDDFIT